MGDHNRTDMNDGRVQEESESESDLYNSNDTAGENEIEVNKTLAVHETRTVQRLRIMFALVIVACTILVAVGVYMYTSGVEQQSFKDAFAIDANKVLEAIGNSLDKTMGAVDAYAVSLMSSARATNQTWPFVYIPDFPVRTAKVLSLSESIYIGVFPIVTRETRSEWEAFSLEYAKWVNISMKIQESDPNYHGPVFYNWTAKGEIHHDFFDIPQNVTRIMLPTWQAYPVIPRYPPFNWDLMSVQYDESIYKAMDNKEAVMSYAYNVITGTLNDFQIEEIEAFTDYYSDYVKPGVDPGEPISDLIYPLIDELDAVVLNPNEVGQSSVVGVLEIIIYWRDLMKDILQRGSNGIVVVYENACAPSFTYQVNGPRVVFIGTDDHHDLKYNSMKVTGGLSNLEEFSVRSSTYTGPKLSSEFCPFTINVYPSETMEAAYTSASPILFTCVAILIFLLTSGIFVLYDYMVERRQKVVMQSAIRSSAIVSSLFPSNVRDQLDFGTHDTESVYFGSNKKQLQRFLNDNGDVEKRGGGAPIAELFPDTTVLFADISGFTAWSSVRDPSQVFTLLETLYNAFDRIAERRGVFKVETVGDCYVAVVGLPKPRNHHAVVMARFAEDCRQEMAGLTRDLEETLGPETCELSLRIGLNSGPTTAGVLRGAKSRFQLFGDTVNTAARMESHGERNRIHCSQKTADVLVAAGKGHWLVKRNELVQAKGKGKMQTYWVELKSATSSHSGNTVNTGCSETEDEEEVLMEHDVNYARLDRYVTWNLDVFEGVLKTVIAQRKHSSRRSTRTFDLADVKFSEMPLAEVTDMVALPKFDRNRVVVDGAEVRLDASVVFQLREYISVVARMYRNNPFHNFEHASHVVMATKKLLLRVANPDCQTASEAHDSTYGITSDPVIQLATLFAALVHDCDHPGVPNAQLIKENPAMAAQYKCKSVAEQNSIDIAWNLLMQDTFADLQNALFASDGDLRRFRQLVVNAVMATDIFDKDIKERREARWEKAFSENSVTEKSTEISNRRATIVLEYIIQTADVSHCMQHWKIYQKWNQCLFEEMYLAYEEGRSENDPTAGWFQGELWFFDHYIIPLAKKLKECGVFGVSCDEFLDYAKDNRDEVANKGNAIAEEWSEELKKEKRAYHTDRMLL